jgi:hypothetical protein
MSSDLETYGEPFPARSARRSYLTFPQFTLSRSPIYSTASTCTFDLAPNATRRSLTAAYLRWEFLTTLDFEWEVFTGRRPWKWSFVVYLAARLLALMSVILTFIGFNLTTHFNCNVGCLFVRVPPPLEADLITGLVPICASFIVVLCRYRLVFASASWVSDSQADLFLPSSPHCTASYLGSPSGDETRLSL